MSILLAAVTAALYVWRVSLPGQLGDIPNSFAGAYRLLLVAANLSLILAPAAVVAWVRWRRNLHLLDVQIGLAFGLLLIAGRLIDAGATGRLPQIFLDYNMTQYGVPTYDILTGGRPLLFSDELWAALGALALVSTIVVCGVAFGIAGAYVRQARGQPRSIVPALATPAGVLAIFAAGTAAGLVWFSLNQLIYDRYCWILVPPLAALLLFRPRDSAWTTEIESTEPVGRLARVVTDRRASLVGGVLVAVISLTSLAYLLNSAAFDGARWRAGQGLVGSGLAPDSVDAGYEWMGYHASTAADLTDPVRRMNWWQAIWPKFRLCGLVASTPQQFGGSRLVAADEAAYRLFLFAGPEVPLYLYRVVTVACPSPPEGQS